MYTQHRTPLLTTHTLTSSFQAARHLHPQRLRRKSRPCSARWLKNDGHPLPAVLPQHLQLNGVAHRARVQALVQVRARPADSNRGRSVSPNASTCAELSHDSVAARLASMFGCAVWQQQHGTAHLMGLRLKATMMSPSMRRPLVSRLVPWMPAFAAGPPLRVSSTRMPCTPSCTAAAKAVGRVPPTHCARHCERHVSAGDVSEASTSQWGNFG